MIKQIIVFFLKPLCYLAFDRKFLKGRWFQSGQGGWVWAVKALWFQKLLGFNRHIPFPISPSSKVSNPQNIIFHPDNLDNFQSNGCYFQNYNGKITLEHGVYIAPNVGIITSNHNIENLDESLPGKDVVIGKDSWLGFGSVVLPGVVLGPKTIVAAGAVVSKSFPQGNCVLAGVPATQLKRL